ncbi:MAG: L-histidine N(alpha)-methyltransferase [Alphaproteobacteria bacterium]|nr:L-histidine N(alpha)-methyltransferase [Alphaproteobacteria bacterium]
MIEAATQVDQRAAFRADVLAGLGKAQKAVPAKYFYDARGSALFEEICTLAEYYPTRTETAMLERLAPEIARHVGAGATLIEYGSGASRKIRALLEALPAPAAYMPIDISLGHLQASARRLALDYPGLPIVPVVGDYTAPLNLPVPPGARLVIFFPGSTIGNLAPADAAALLAQAAGRVGRGGSMLVGVDLKKDPAILHRAYTDRRGVTADFNLNLLDRINRELDGDFRRAQFRHRAFYDPVRGRIEMHLVSLIGQAVSVEGQRFDFRVGETIHTENSYKYSLDEFRAMAGRAGFVPEAAWSDPDCLFAIHLLRAGTMST